MEITRRHHSKEVDVHVSKVIVFTLVLALCGAAAAQTTYVFVGNYNDNTISGYAANHLTGTLTPVRGSPFATGTNPIWPALDQQCRFIFTSNFVSNNLTGYTIDASTGAAAQIAGSPFPAGTSPGYSSLDRFGKFLYVPNYVATETVSAFSINTDTGTLSPIPGSPFTTGGAAGQSQVPGIFVDPSNRFLYATNPDSGTVSGFTVNPNTGALTAIPGSPWSTNGSEPTLVTSDHTGHFLYVSNTISGNVEVFGIDQSTGALSQNGSVPVAFAIYAIRIDSTNRFAYVGQNGGGIHGYSVDSTTGLLTPLSGFPITTESPQGNPLFAFDPDGRYLYTSNQATNSVGVWAIDAFGGLTQVPGSPFPAGSQPSDIATCTADQDQAVVSLSGDNFFTGNQTVNGIVSANLFSGSGAGLTGVNAVSLGGIVAANYARLDVGNSFTGNQSVSGSLSISQNLSTTGTTTLGSGGTAIVEHLSNTFNPSFAALKPATCATATFTFTGASDGDTLALGVPNERMTLASGVILNFFAWVSGANTVTIQECNLGGAPQKTAGSGAVRIDLWKH